jgi:hypothetical protein
MHPELSRAQWRKSSYSGNSGNCVEVAQFAGLVAVRDSKDPDGPMLVLTRDNWLVFLHGMNCGGNHLSLQIELPTSKHAPERALRLFLVTYVAHIVCVSVHNLLSPSPARGVSASTATGNPRPRHDYAH